jgi:hypothetical protein
MNRNTPTFCFLVLALFALGGCSKPPAQQAKKVPLDKIQGKAQVLVESGGASDAALNAGGSSVYLWQGANRYRLFFKTATEVVHGDEYVAEGVYAQKAIEDIGDPDQGKNGYPLPESCTRVVKIAWTNLAFDEIDARAEALRARVKRYPARPVFLVTRIRPVTAEERAASTGAKKDTAAAQKNIREISVPAEKQRALLIEGATTQPAPLWEPAGGKVSCEVVIGTDGTISSLESGKQLCETVQWAKFRFQPPVQGSRPVTVRTEVEMQFEPRK